MMIDQRQAPKIIHNSLRIRAKRHATNTLVIGHYQIGQLIGKGGYANVYKGIELHTKKEIAVKVVNLHKHPLKIIQRLKRQIAIHRKLNHPNIIKIYETIWTDSNAYIFMELAKGEELFSYLNRLGPIRQQNAVKIFKQLVSAVQYMHGLNIAHRDIKTENIVIDQKFNPKLIDFGLSRIFSSSSDDYLKTFCGSPSYLSPQLFQNKLYSGQRVDIWCLGVALYVILEACLPFDGQDKEINQKNIKYLNWHKPIYSTPQACELYRCIFTRENYRCSLDDIHRSSFLTKFYQHKNLKSMLNTKSTLNQNDIFQLIKKVSQMLNVKQDQVKTVVETRLIGQIFCVYQILFEQKLANSRNQPKKRQKKFTKSIQVNRKDYKTVQLKTLNNKIKSRANSLQHQASVIKILPVVNVHNAQNAQNSEKNPNNIQKDKLLKNIEHQNYNMQINNQQQVAKEVIIAKASRFKNIFAKDLHIKLAKPRLRQDSPDSPKRILDCVKRYN